MSCVLPGGVWTIMIYVNTSHLKHGTWIELLPCINEANGSGIEVTIANTEVLLTF